MNLGEEELDLTEEEIKNLGLEIFSKEERNILALFAKALFSKLYTSKAEEEIENLKIDKLELESLRRQNSVQRQELEWFYKRCSNAVHVNYNPIVLIKKPLVNFDDMCSVKKKILGACFRSKRDLHKNIRNHPLGFDSVDREIYNAWQSLETNIHLIMQDFINKAMKDQS